MYPKVKVKSSIRRQKYNKYTEANFKQKVFSCFEELPMYEKTFGDKVTKNRNQNTHNKRLIQDQVCK